jgi:hypothetical protein
VTGLVWAALGGIVTFIVMAALGDMVSEEVRDRLDHLPHAILRLAAMRLDPEQRTTIYDDEWLAELTYILKGDEARPVTRLYHGTRFALGILVAARQIADQLRRRRAQDALGPLGMAIIELQLLAAAAVACEKDLAAARVAWHQDVEAANGRISLLQAGRAGAFDHGPGWRLQRRVRELGGIGSRVEALRSELATLTQNIVDQSLTGSPAELFGGDNGAELYADWAHLVHTIGSRSKNRDIRRVSRSGNLQPPATP